MLTKISKVALFLAVFATQDTNAFLPKIFGNGGNKNKDENMVGAGKGKNNKDKNKDAVANYDTIGDNEQLRSLIISVSH
jgi:hypothetical protein